MSNTTDTLGDQDPEIEEQSFDILTPSEVNQIERAEIDSAIATARAFPRDLARVKKNMRAMACLDAETAAAMNYSVPRAGKKIQGPSIRMAEVAVACYGNISVHSRIIETTATYVKAQGVGHDLENNVRSGVEVRRRVHPSKNARDKKGALEDAIQLASAAAAAIAFREAAFKVIPRAIIKPVAEEAKKVGAGDAKTFTQRRNDALAKFAEYGIKAEQVYQYLGVSGFAAVTFDHLQDLFGILTAIQDGITTPERAFMDQDDEDQSPQTDHQTGVLTEVSKTGSIYSASFNIPQLKRVFQVWTADEAVGEMMTEYEDGDVIAELKADRKGDSFQVISIKLARPDDAGKGKDDLQ